VITDEEYGSIELDFDEATIEQIGNNEMILQKALDELKPRDREIMLMYFLNYEEGKNMQSEVLDRIENTFSTTRANIRQIINRSKKKIKSLVGQEVKLRA
jgi:DNA-directed RNA polymerase sigma subunit (sigma70/sigma32)